MKVFVMKNKHEHYWNAVEYNVYSDISYLIDVTWFMKCVNLIIESSNNVSYTESEENYPKGAYFFVEVCFFNKGRNLFSLLSQTRHQPKDIEKKQSSHEIENKANDSCPLIQ